MADMEIAEAIGIVRNAGIANDGPLGRAAYVVLQELALLKQGPIVPDHTVELQISLARDIFLRMVVNGKSIEEDAFDLSIYGEDATNECLAVAESFYDTVRDRYNIHCL